MAQTLKGQVFTTETGKKFTVIDDKFFPAGKHDRANGKYLDSLKAGYLVSASYQGHPVPLVTIDAGVVKLSEVRVGEVRLKRATDIAASLGVSKTRKPVKLKPA